MVAERLRVGSVEVAQLVQRELPLRQVAGSSFVLELL